MSDAEIEGLIEALRQDGPGERDAARVRARLAAAGIVTASVLGHGTATASMPVAKATGRIARGIATRWASLSLLPKLGVVAAVSAAAAAGPIYGARLVEGAAPTAAARPTAMVNAATKPGRGAVRLPAPANGTPAETAPVVARTAGHPAVNAGPTVSAGSTATVNAGVGAETAAGSPARPDAPNAKPGAHESSSLAMRSTVSTAGDPVAAVGDRALSAPEGTARFVEERAAITPPPVTGSTLAEETALLDAAFAALRAGDAANATTLVAAHAQRFPHGLLWRERERARAQLEALRAAPR
jgi:hypothetical protein